MAFTTETHAVGDWDGPRAIGRGAQHADGLLTRLIGNSVHLQVVVELRGAQLRCEI